MTNVLTALAGIFFTLIICKDLTKFFLRRNFNVREYEMNPVIPNVVYIFILAHVSVYITYICVRIFIFF